MLNKILFLPSFQVVQSQTIKNTIADGIKEERPLTQHAQSWKVLVGRLGQQAERCEKAFQANAFYVYVQNSKSMVHIRNCIQSCFIQTLIFKDKE